MKKRSIFLMLLLLGLTAPAQAEDRFWILWERYRYSGENCPNGQNCVLKRDFASRPLQPQYPETIYRMFGAAGPRGFAHEPPSLHPEAPQVCDPKQAQLAVGFDPIQLPQSLKIEALRGVDQLHVDLRNLKAPPGFSDSFGTSLHRRFVATLERAGIEVLTEEEVTTVPGHPKLSIFFSFTDPDGHCDYTYSVFASLSQEVLLVRDLRIKITAGVWAYSTGSTAMDHHGTEEDAILRVAEAFIRDQRQVNPR